jgi:hypothetical protein
MHNLLQSYDEENSFLNKQVSELLNQKRIIESKYAYNSKENLERSFRGPFGYQYADSKKHMSNAYPNESHNKKYEHFDTKNCK